MFIEAGFTDLIVLQLILTDNQSGLIIIFFIVHAHIYNITKFRCLFLNRFLLFINLNIQNLIF